ncbi:hypothetical protein ABZV60_16060 [Streptomyces sp. NPDC004787]
MTGCRPRLRSPTQSSVRGDSTTMNVITNLLAGVLHFLGWLV